ncbi:hypothetical protein ZIOFF_054275 [Zingiber officinale]|uniref:Rad60/SUMO-like domain-containing protein n=1 Tax=Zingiber officinale TaxID=94328 RepID=A0A8J5FFQ2_ZINOF|nr:hypothetical protein ZIOFF_054275 [Zingiber officinale]
MVNIEKNKLAIAIDNRISIRDGNHLSMKMSQTTKLGKVMEVFCESKCLPLTSLSSTFDHWKVGEDQTPEQLGMEDGAEMEAHKSAFGG